MGVKVFEPKTLKEVVHRAILVEQSINLGHGGFVGAPTTLGSKGNQNSGGNKKPPFPKGNQSQQQKGSNPQAQSGGGGSNFKNQRNVQRNKRNQKAQPAQLNQSFVSRYSHQRSNAPSIGRGSGRGTGCYSCGQIGSIASHCPQ